MDKQLFHYKGIKPHMFIVGILTVSKESRLFFKRYSWQQQLQICLMGQPLQLSFPIFLALLLYFLFDIFCNG